MFNAIVCAVWFVCVCVLVCMCVGMWVCVWVVLLGDGEREEGREGGPT